MKKVLLRLVYIILIALLGIVQLQFSYSQSFWLLDKAYETSKNESTIVDTIDKGSLAGENSLFVKVTNFLLQLTVLIWVTAFLFGGAKMIMSFGDEWKFKWWRDKLLITVMWLVLVFMSLTLITIINSISSWTLTILQP